MTFTPDFAPARVVASPNHDERKSAIDILLLHYTGMKSGEAACARLCDPISRLVLRNRGAGPFGLLNLVDERCGGRFDDIDDVIPPDERNAFMADYKAAAGFAMETLNRAPPTLVPGARVAAAVPAPPRVVAV